jgi:class 3 adenylate cyclase/tetratricopeptide (TPR) repeat protein
VTCSSCGSENPTTNRFCGGCGGSLTRACPACAHVNPPDHRFCGACGVCLVTPPDRLPNPGHEVGGAGNVVARKIVTVVFADLIGSTALHERLDAESVRSLMGRYYGALHAAVEAHGCTVVKLLGDGVMAAFGLPRVAEDDAMRAVRAALAMQQAFRALAREQSDAIGDVGLRIAVNTGEVVVDAATDDVIGDPINVAARLQDAAQDGDVVIGETTRRLVGALVTLAPLGPVTLRGRSETVAAYRVVSLEPPGGTSAVAFVGREEELRRLAAVYDGTLAAPTARLAVVLGSPGLGKSRLLDEFTNRLDGATVLVAHCEAAGGATFAPLAKALRAVLGVATGTGDHDLRTAIEAAVPGGDADRNRIAAGISALLAGTPAAPEETFFVVRRLLTGLAAAHPVVLVLDDIHWAEPLLLDLVEHLVQWSTGVPLLLLAAARPELRDARSSLTSPGRLATDVVMLGGLDAAAATRLAANVIGADALPAAVAGRVLATSEGNPLFLGELVRMLVDDGALKREGDLWTTGVDLTAVDMPPTIHALLAARIERLRAEDRLVLERAAIVGRQFSRAAVAHLLPHEVQDDLDARVEALRRGDLIEPDAGWFLGEPALRFHHGLIRDAAYRRVLKGTRVELHERVADWIESRVEGAVDYDETIGWHLEQAHRHLGELGPIDARGRALGERAAGYLAAAGRRALARDDVPVAADLLGRALERLDGADPARADLALDRCEALLAAGDVGHAAGAIDELGRWIGPTAPASANRLRGWHTCFAAQLAVLTAPQTLRATADTAAGAAETLATAGDLAGEAKAHSVHAMALERLGRIGACETALDRALAAARQAGDRRRANTVLAGAPLAALWGPGPVPRASGRCLDVVRVLRITQGAPAVEAVALRCQAVLEALRGRAEAAQRMIASSRRMVEELGISQGLLDTEFFAGLIALIEGDATAAEQSFRAAYDGFRTHGLRIDGARAAALLGLALLQQDRAAEAEAFSHESEALAGDDLHAAITWRRVRAEALARRGEHAAAIDLAQAAVDIAATTDALLHHAGARLALAAALRLAGRQTAAAAEEARAVELWEAKGATVLVERARGSAARTDQAPPDRIAPVRPVRRRVRANAATANVARLEAAIAARDADALPPVFADHFQFIDHDIGVDIDRQGALVTWCTLLETRDGTRRAEPLATLGGSLALCRSRVSASGVAGRPFEDSGASEMSEDWGAFEMEWVELVEVDGEKRCTRTENFATSKLGDAVARLYERYAELLHDGPERTRSAATASSVAALFGPPDFDRYTTVVGPNVELVHHHGLVGQGSSRGRQAWLRIFRVIFETQAYGTNTTEDILALTPAACLVRWRVSAIDRATGGSVENTYLMLAVFGPDGLLARNEYFAPGHEEEALARFDELVTDPQGARPVERRVRPNAATANAARLDAAVAAREADALLTLFADESDVIDHPTGLAYDRRGALSSFRALLTTQDPTYRHEPLATLGDSLALCRGSMSATGAAGAKFDVGPYSREVVALIEVDASGRRRRTEDFAVDRLGDAIVRLYERYAELLPEGPERSRMAATARSVAEAVGPLDLDRFVSVLAPEVEQIDHRRMIGVGSIHGIHAFRDTLGTLFEVATNIANRVDDVLDLRAEAFLMRVINVGAERVGGGSYERPFIALVVFGSGGLITRFEQFDVGHETEALARFDDLKAEPVTLAPHAAERRDRRVRPNAATAHATRLDAVVGAGDVAALSALVADDAEHIHHPTNTTFDRRGLLLSLQSISSARGATYRHQPLATLGDSLALCRLSPSASGFAGSPFGSHEKVEIELFGVDANGRQHWGESFASDRLGCAIVRLYERYAELLPEGPARTRAATTARSVAAQVGPIDVDCMAGSLAPGMEVVDHRILGTWSACGAESALQHWRSWLELVHVAARFDDVLALRLEAFLVGVTFFGTDRARGGPFEIPTLSIWTFGADGLNTRVEVFDVGRRAEALARFDELVASKAEASAPAGPPLRVENAATRAANRLVEAWATRDWERFASVFPTGVRLIDRRRMVQLEVDWTQFLDSFRRYFEMTSSRHPDEVLATRGNRLALLRSTWTGADGDSGPSEIAWLSILEVDECGEPAAWVTFDLVDLDAAYAELDARYLAGEAAPYARTWETCLDIVRATAARDWERLAAVFAPGFVAQDHRPVGLFTSLSRDAYVASVRALLDLRPDATLRLAHVLAIDDCRALTVGRWSGGDTDGAFETPAVVVRDVHPDGSRRWHLYNLDQLDEAWTCYHALPPDPLRIPPNAATRIADRHLDAVVARAWDAVAATCSPSLVFEDRRRLMRTIGDRDMFITNCKLVGSSSPRVARTVLATAGDRLALGRLRWSLQRALEPLGMDVADGDEPEVEIEHLLVTEVDSEGRIVAVVVFDPDDRRAAAAEMFERYARSDAARCIPAGLFEGIRAVNARDLARLRAALPDDYVVHDRRRTGAGRLENTDHFVASQAAEFELTSELTVEPLYVVAAEEHGLLATTHTFGTLADGGEFELVYVLLVLFQDDGVVGMEVFEPEDLEVARARFEELRPRATTPLTCDRNNAGGPP